MEQQIYIPLISALVGALIGSASSVLVIFIQAHYQAKRELITHGIQIAVQEPKTQNIPHPA